MEFSTTLSASFAQHLCSRIFERNDFGSLDALVSAIKTASAISPETNWRDRKSAFNKIAELAPMRSDPGYLLNYDEIPGFLDEETKAFSQSFGNSPASKALSLSVVYISADDCVGSNVITRDENGVLDNRPCDWGRDYPEAETRSVVLLLQTGEGRLLDRALIDGETWRTIEDERGSTQFFEAILDTESIQDTLQDLLTKTPSA